MQNGLQLHPDKSEILSCCQSIALIASVCIVHFVLNTAAVSGIQQMCLCIGCVLDDVIDCILSSYTFSDAVICDFSVAAEYAAVDSSTLLSRV